MRPVIGITCDTSYPLPESEPTRADQPHRCSPTARWKYESPFEYADAVQAAGGIPLLLPCLPDAIPDYLRLCHAFLFSGGDDPDTTAFGEPVHPAAKIMHPRRQQFETALLQSLQHTAHPVLGICLGMQMMALVHGGRLHQHLPDAPGLTAEQAAAHKGVDHSLKLVVPVHPVIPTDSGLVRSHHHQAVADPGSLRTVAISGGDTGGVIEAIDAGPEAPRFYLGVQWHPERTADASMGESILRHFVAAATPR